MVRDDVFACEVQSDAEEYRRDRGVGIHPMVLPLASPSSACMCQSAWSIAGLDLRRTDDNGVA